MNGNRGWSLRLGRLGPIDVRLHASFVFFAIFALYVGWLNEGVGASSRLAEWSIAVLIVSVLLHESARLLTAFHFGGYVRQVVLGPLGGLARVHVPGRSRCELAATLAGTFAAAAMCAACVPALHVADAAHLARLLNPFAPVAIDGAVMLVFRINWLLMLVNLLPAFPLAGARALRLGLDVDPSGHGSSRALLVTIRLSKAISVVLLVAAWLLRDLQPPTVPPVWVVLSLLATYVYFSTRQEERHAADPRRNTPADAGLPLAGFELDRRLDPPEAELVGSWYRQRRVVEHEQQRLTEIEEDRLVDKILDQVHRSGLDSLSEQDQRLLDRVSRRYRNRRDVDR